MVSRQLKESDSSHSMCINHKRLLNTNCRHLVRGICHFEARQGHNSLPAILYLQLDLTKLCGTSSNRESWRHLHCSIEGADLFLCQSAKDDTLRPFHVNDNSEQTSLGDTVR